MWKNPRKMCGCKWGLLKAKEKEIQREHDEVQVESLCFSFSDAFKTYTNKWGGQIQEVPTQ
jgi:hypothetical protein